MPPTTARTATRSGDRRGVARRAAPKPDTLRPDFERIPTALREHARWVLWRLEWSAAAGKWTKVPYRADGAGKASTTNPDTWGTFDAARDAYERGELDADGVGWVIGEGIVGGDVDGCRDPATGELTADAAAILAEMRTYSEVSPSGTGVRYFARGALPATGRKRGPFEMYDGDGGRYLTVTGHQLDGTPDVIEPRDAELAAVHARHVAAPPRPDRNGEHHGLRPTPTGKGAHLSDAEVLEAMKRNRRNGAELARLYDGDLAQHAGDHSAADMALVGALVWWCDGDADQVDRLFRASGLMRAKWDRNARQGETYGEGTIREALEGHAIGSGYQGRAPQTPAELGPPPREDSDPGPEPIEGEPPQSPPARVTVKGAPPAPKRSTPDALTPTPDDALAAFPHTDAGNAERLVHYAGGLVRYAPGVGWLLWTGTHWAPDPSELVLRIALDTIRATAVTAELIRARGDDLGERLHKHARSSEAAGKLRAMLDIARTDPAVHILADQLDADPWLLNTESGVLDLRTGKLRPHDPAALCTKLAPVVFDLDAEHPALAALLDILDQDGRAEYLRHIAGQALTGRSTKSAYVWTGPSGTVKSTTADAIAAALGPYAVNVEPSTLTVSRHGHSAGGPRADLVALRGARLALSAELPNGGRLDSELVKRLTGRDPITARAPHAREVMTFTPGHTLVMHSNHDPQADWSDDGMRARLRVVPFTVRPSKPDPKVRDALVSDPQARAAVLAWAVAGAVRWHRDGERDADPPPVVSERTAAYWRELDPFAPWAEDALTFDQGDVFVPTKVIADSYQQWCETNGERPKPSKALGAWLRDRADELGITSAKGPKGARGWRGLRLRGQP
jgi:putative DNA primase/helicase